MNIGHEVGVTAQQPGNVGHVIPTANNVRMIPILDGVSKYYKFAKTIVGSGQGTIILRGKLSDIGATVKLLDGEGLANRLYLNLNDATNGLTAGTLTVTVNETDNKAIYNELIEIVVEGDFTALELATLFARFSGTECANFQPFFVSYEDQSQSFEYDFTKAALPYILPKSFELQSNMVLENHTAVLDGTEADYETVSLGLGVQHIDGNPIFYRVTASNTEKGKFKVNSTIDDSPWFDSNGVHSGIIVNPGTYVSVQTAAGDQRYIGKLKIEIYDIPNALIFQNPSANIADNFEPMIQRPDGHWVGIQNYFGPSNLNVTWSQSGSLFTKNSNAWGGMGELPSYNTIEQGDWICSYTSSGPNLSIFTKNAENTANDALALESGRNTIEVHVPTAGLWFDSTTANGVSLSQIKFNKKITLSEYLLKRYQREQMLTALNLYVGSNKSRFITETDGIDDFVTGLDITLNADYDIYGWFYVAQTPAGNSALIGGSGGSPPASDNFCIYVNASALSAQVPRSASSAYISVNYEVDAVNFYHLQKRGETVTLRCGVDVNSVTYSDYQPIHISQLNNWSSNLQFAGHNLGNAVIDHDKPLPIGHGGNSGYWALDDEPGNIAEQVLYIDSKGRTKAKHGKGQGAATWQGLPTDFSTSEAFTKVGENWVSEDLSTTFQGV